MNARVYLEPGANASGVRVTIRDGDQEEDVTLACQQVVILPRSAVAVVYPKDESGVRRPRFDAKREQVIVEDIPVVVITGHWQTRHDAEAETRHQREG